MEGLFQLKREQFKITFCQVLSESIEGFSKYGSTDTVETQRFTRMFDQFFDCLNVRHPDVHIKRRKPNLKPYSRPDDERLKVSNTPHTHALNIHIVVGEYVFGVSQRMGRQRQCS